MRAPAQQRLGRHDHARRAEAALRAQFLVESALQVAQIATRALPLDRLDGAALAGRGEREAGKPRRAVDQHGAGPALAPVTAALGAGEAAPFAQVVDEKEPILERLLAPAPIHCERDKLGHSATRYRTRAAAV